MRKPDVTILRRSRHGWCWKRTAVPVSTLQICCGHAKLVKACLIGSEAKSLVMLLEC